MKKFLAAAFAGALLFSGVAVAKETTTTMKVNGWHCGGCSNRTARAIKKLDGVADVKTDVKAKTVTVTFDDEKTSAEAVEEAIAALNYTVEK